MSKNRFAGLQAVKKLQAEKQVEVIIETPSDTPTVITEVKRGRPNGKRTNVEFQQVTAYVRRDTYRKVSIKLIDRESKGEFSELVEELLQQWLEN
jgi:hypothetical protein